MSKLTKLINKRIGADLISNVLSVLGLSQLFFSYAAKKNHSKTVSGKKEYEDKSINSFEIPAYQGQNIIVRELISFFKKHKIKPEDLNILVLGSIANYTESAYSDFDAVAIINDEIFKNPQKTAKIFNVLNKAQKILYRQDILQHHGWFITTKNELKYGTKKVLPGEVFKSCKSLIPNQIVKLEVFETEEDKSVIRQRLMKTAKRIYSMAEKNKRFNNQYLYKGLLSQLMLLPAVYHQVKFEKGIVKRKSFEVVRNDFLQEEWKVMDEINEIRKKWFVKTNFIQKYALSSNHPILRRYKYLFAPKTPKELLPGDINKFRSAVKLFLTSLQDKIQNELSQSANLSTR